MKLTIYAVNGNVSRLGSMVRQRIKHPFLFMLLTTFLAPSCKKLIQIPAPEDQVTSDQVFSDEQTAISAVRGLYSEMMERLLAITNGGVSLYAGLSADEIYHTGPDANVTPFTDNAIPTNSSVIENYFWSPSYQNIYQANAIIEGLEASNTLEAATKRQLEGEAKFIRAFYYFYLVNLFGEVPLITSTNYLNNDTVRRANETRIYAQIVSDLRDAQTLLPADYVSDARTRVNKWTAAALLARVFLYQKDWKDAESEATEVIGSGMYQLEADLNNVFLKDSKETIWQMEPQGYNNSAEGYNFIPSLPTIKPSYAVTDYLFDAFESGDRRKDDWLKGDSIMGQVYYYPYKYKVKRGTPPTEYNVVLRLAEQYLIRSEARAEQNNISGAEEDLNRIRNRSGLSDVTMTSRDDLLNAIQHERQVELFCEWGNRWLDLKREGRADSVLAVEKSGWKATDVLYPIPRAELQLDPFLTQNAGY